MSGILVIAEARQGELREVSFELLGGGGGGQGRRPAGRWWWP